MKGEIFVCVCLFYKNIQFTSLPCTLSALFKTQLTSTLVKCNGTTAYLLMSLKLFAFLVKNSPDQEILQLWSSPGQVLYGIDLIFSLHMSNMDFGYCLYYALIWLSIYIIYYFDDVIMIPLTGSMNCCYLHNKLWPITYAHLTEDFPEQ